MKNQRFFSSALLAWNRNLNKRQMPWKGEKDPYKIWISEIILQQTRVEQGINYYNRFIDQFSNIGSLATAPEKKVYKLWEGLGYYSRCKNLIATAIDIHKNHAGIFPQKFEDILSLKGIGPYTASAIASFAYNKPYAVLDGNVFRVLARFFGEEVPVNTTEGKKFYSDLAERLLDKNQPALYNQAIMDFGATICKPALPLCSDCFFQKKCIAFKKNKVADLPVNKKIIKQKDRFFNYLVLENEGKFYLRKRTGKDIWQNLYEFILIETKSWIPESELTVNEQFLSIFNQVDFKIIAITERTSQKLTHQKINGRFIHARINKPLAGNNYFRATKDELKGLPFPKFIASYLSDKNVSLNSF